LALFAKQSFNSDLQTDMASTGFQMPPQAPPNFNHNPTSVLNGIRAILDNTRKVQDEIVATVLPEDATFTNVLLPLAEDENNNIALRKLFKFFSSTSTSEEL
jgi:metallopeptidase MepB